MQNSFKTKAATTPKMALITILVVAFSLTGCIFVEYVDVPTATPESTEPGAVSIATLDPPATQEAPADPAPEPTVPLAPTVIPLPLVLDGNIVWTDGFETGDISGITEVGDFYKQGSGAYQLVTPHAHSGNVSVELTIDSLAPTDTGSHAAYLFHTRYDLLPDDGYYYSAWYYIPTLVKPEVYWNIMQWKSTQDGSTPQPIYMINVRDSGPDKLYLYLGYLPNREDVRKFYHQEHVDIPVGQWFNVETYYKRAQDNTGQIQIWQDGIEIFNITNTTTVLSDNSIHWSVNSYSSGIEPAPLTLYVDDMAISKTRLVHTPD